MKTTEIHWELTNKCNLHCSYCRPDSGAPRDNELTTAEALTALQKFSAAGVKRICFTGGEPFMRSDLRELLEESIRLKIKVALITNATLIDSADLDLIKRLGIDLGISLDGATPEVNDKKRGVGVFAKALKVIEGCHLKKISFKLYATVSRSNIKKLPALIAFAQAHDSPLHLKEISRGGRTDQADGELLLPTEKNYLKNFIPEMAKKVFNDEADISEENCWADGGSLFMNASGDVYLCNEIFVRQSNQKLGNIKYSGFKLVSKNRPKPQCQCCYGVAVSEHAVTIYDTGHDCEFLSSFNLPITTLQQLYRELDNLYEGISDYCFKCTDNDCLGYIWLLKTEANRLYRAGIPIVQINNGPSFIHSFAKDEAGIINVSARQPVCSQVDCSGRICTIRKKRPLVCHIYPAGLETLKNDKIVWAMHLDCLFIKKMAEQGLIDDLERKFLSIINRVSQPLFNEIIETYQAVNAISAFPNGSNNFKILKGGIENVEMHSGS